MRVLMTDGLVMHGGAKSGVGYYTSELVSALRRANGDAAVCSWYPSWWLSKKMNWLNRQSARYEKLAQRPGKLAWAERKVRGKALAVLQSVYPLMRHPYRESLRRIACDLYHEPNFLPIELEIPTVVSVHDLSAIRFPEWHPPKRVELFEKLFHKGLKRAVHLIAISEFGKSEIVNHLGWPADKVSVTYMGVRPTLRRVEGAELARAMAALKLNPGYLLHVGTVEPRKNLMTLLRAYRGLPAAVRDRHPLVLAGGKGWHAEDVHTYLENEGAGCNVRWLGYVPDELCSALYSGARALAFPTFYEGFGMPTIEMMACGGAVLASTAGAVAETVGGQAHLTDPNDEPGWRDALQRVCTDDEWWKQLRAGAEEVAKRYTWDRCAEQTLVAYRRALGREQPRVETAPVRRAA